MSLKVTWAEWLIVAACKSEQKGDFKKKKMWQVKKGLSKFTFVSSKNVPLDMWSKNVLGVLKDAADWMIDNPHLDKLPA